MTNKELRTGKMHVLLGVHAAGKTSVGRILAQNGFSFFPEIAADIIERRMPWQLPPSFDEAVIAKEFIRDQLFRHQSQPFFVETWHLGNLAYARVRNPEIASTYAELAKSRIEEFLPRIYFLRVSPEVVLARTAYFVSKEDRERATEFFARVQLELLNVLEPFRRHTVEIDATCGISMIVGALLRCERPHCKGTVPTLDA